jgi:hypothetical protein
LSPYLNLLDRTSKKGFWVRLIMKVLLAGRSMVTLSKLGWKGRDQ